MKKTSNPAAYFSRLQQLAEVNKLGVKDTKNRGMGTLIDYKKTHDGVSYGIIKENHHYYIKKSGLKENPDTADFMYIGGLENVTEYQYKSLAEADKKRNMMLKVLNESVDFKVNKTNTKIVKEDVVDDKIKSMEQSAAELDNAGEKTVPMSTPEIPDLTDDQPIPDGEDVPEEAPETELPADDEDEEFKDIQSDLGKAIAKMNEKQLTKSQVKSVLNSVIAPLKKELAQYDVKEREELAEPIIKAEDVDGEADLEANLPDEEALAENEMTAIEDNINKINDLKKANGEEPVDAKLLLDKYVNGVETEEVTEAKCEECGTFGQYAESRGYNKKALVEASNEERASIISGYINAFNEGKNSGDAKVISVLAKKPIVESLINDYGHKSFVDKYLKPEIDSLNESTFKSRAKLLSEEFEIGTSGNVDKSGEIKGLAQDVVGEIMKLKNVKPEKAQEMLKELMGASVNEEEINELFDGLKDKFGAVKDTVKSTVGAVKDKYDQNLATRQQATFDKAEAEKEERYNKQQELIQQGLRAAKGETINKIKQHAQALVDEIKELNANRVARGLEPLPAGSLFRSMANQVNTGTVDLTKSKKGYTDEVAVPAGSVEVQPNMLKEDDELEVDLENTPDVEELTLDNETPEMNNVGFAPDSTNMGIVTSDTNTVDVNVDGNNKTINIKLNESVKTKNYIRAKLQELAGLRKPSLNESVKSDSLKKLDEMIVSEYNKAMKK